MVRRAARSRLRRKKGAILAAYTTPALDTLVVCLDELGPLSAKTYPGQRLIGPPTPAQPRPRATQEVSWARTPGGAVFGALLPTTGEVLTTPVARATGPTFFAFLETLEAWLTARAAPAHIVLVLDNHAIHKTLDSALFRQAHPDWTFCFQPTRAAWLNLIEPWWRILRSLALAGRQFSTWADLTTAIEEATAYWNAHRHPFIWGRPAPTPRARRMPGVGRTPIFLPEELAA
jgi:hypothetical protein